jgi:predicted ATPase
MLLLLDNFEHVMPAGQLLAQLLSACPHLKLLVTSRVVLHLSGEHAYTVPPLSLPDPKEQLPAAQLCRSEAVRLFVERARAARGEFTLTEENARDVAQLCRRLDGLPLALELAAARVRLLPPRTLLARLDSRLRLLTGGPRDLHPRQQTLRATLDWSYSLLDEAERKLFARLAVFAGSWTLQAAEAVCDAGDEWDVTDLLTALLDNSLLTRAAAAGGEPRLSMLETVREYARERLEASGEAEAWRHKHADYYVALAEQVEPELRGPAQAAALNRLEEEHDNLRAAMEWLLRRGDAQQEHLEVAVRLAWAAWLHWVMRGHLNEGRRWLEEVLARGTALPADLRAEALCALGIVLNALGGFPQTMYLLEESAALFGQAGDQRGTAIALTGVGIAAMKRGETERARTLLERALELYRGLSDTWGTAQLLPYLGMLALGQADGARAMEYFDEGLALAREIGDRLAVYKSLYNAACAAQAQGDYARATALYDEGLMLSDELGDRAGAAYCLEGLAGVAGARGEPERAARLLGAAEALLETVGMPRYPYVPDRASHQRVVAAARARLSEPAFATVWAEGRAMTLDQAIAYALSDGPDENDAAG